MKNRLKDAKLVGFAAIFLLFVSTVTQGAPPSGGGKGKPQPGMNVVVAATARPGERILVRIELVNGANVSWVTATTDRAGEIGDSENPPFEFSYVIPTDIVGTLKIIAMGLGVTNDTGYLAESTIQVSTTATLESFWLVSDSYSPFPELPVDNTVQLSWFGMQRRVRMKGLYSDGVTRDLSSPATGTMYQSQNPAIVEVLADGSFRALGEGKTTVLASNSGFSVNVPVEVDFPDPILGDRTGGIGDKNDLALTYSGPIDIGSQQIPMSASGAISLPVNSSQIKFAFHNNSSLGQLGVTPGLVIGSVGKGSNANCSVSFENNNKPPTSYLSGWVNGKIIFSLPSEGGKCVFVLNIEGASDKVADKITVNNPSP